MGNITVNFKTQSGEVRNRTFGIGDGVSVYGKATTLINIGFNPLTKVTMNVLDRSSQSTFYDETLTDFYGDYDFYFKTGAQGKYIVVISAHYIDGIQTIKIPIGVGVKPSPVPTNVSANILDYIKYGLFIAGGVVIYKLYNLK